MSSPPRRAAALSPAGTFSVFAIGAKCSIFHSGFIKHGSAANEFGYSVIELKRQTHDLTLGSIRRSDLTWLRISHMRMGWWLTMKLPTTRHWKSGLRNLIPLGFSLAISIRSNRSCRDHHLGWQVQLHHRVDFHSVPRLTMNFVTSHLPPGSRFQLENAFLNEEAPGISEVFGGLTVKNDGTLEIPDHYKWKNPSCSLIRRE